MSDLKMRASKVSKRPVTSGVRKSRVSDSPSSPTRNNALHKHVQDEFDAVLSGKKEHVKRTKVAPATSSGVRGEKKTNLDIGDSKIYEQHGKLSFNKYNGTADEMDADIRAIEEVELPK